MFPRTPLGNSTNLWDPSENLYGLFDVWSFKKFEAIVSSGLGGGSLIYANVMIRKPPHWFEDAWPVKAEDLDLHYTAVERMLGVKPYPYIEITPKTHQMRQAGAQAGIEWKPAPWRCPSASQVNLWACQSADRTGSTSHGPRACAADSAMLAAIQGARTPWISPI